MSKLLPLLLSLLLLPTLQANESSTPPSSLLTSPTRGEAPRSLEQRVERLERVVQSQALIEMLARIETLQQENQQLRSQLEEMNFQQEQIQQRQRELYLDIDRRLSRLERETPIATTPPLAIEVEAEHSDQGEERSPATTPTETAPPTDPERLRLERESYQNAFELLRDLRYEQAIDAFTLFLRQYPEGRYAHIAQYWSGEAHYARRDFANAITAYQRLIDNFPQSPKLAEAMLKIGYCHFEQQQFGEAQQTMQQLIARFPGTTEAGQAALLLEQMKKPDEATAE
jgi:tol-pal system protein YbgF